MQIFSYEDCEETKYGGGWSIPSQIEGLNTNLG